MRKAAGIVLKAGRIVFIAVAVFLVFCLFFSFTTGPFRMYHWLGTSQSSYSFKPDYIILMGGSGYPAESALMRSWYAANVWKQHPGATVIVAQPAAVCVHPELSDAWGIRSELLLRGVDSSRILLEIKGKNTREEAMEVLQIAPQAALKNCLLVTSPEHMRRAVLTFRKLGFAKVGGVPTFNVSAPADLDYRDDQLGGRKIPLPEVGGSLQLRYQFWNHLHYQVICYRELVALAWYKLKGWV